MRLLAGALLLLMAAAPATKPDRDALTIATYNVDIGMPPGEAAIKAIRATGADVLCIQEVDKNWHAYLSKELKATHPHSLYRDHPNGMAVYSRFALDHAQYLDPPKNAWFPAWAFEVNTPGGAVQVLNVHLRPGVDKTRGPVVGFFWAKTVHPVELESHRKHLKEGLPTIVLGDFNESDSDPGVAWMARQAYTDALPEFDKNTPTWKGKVAGINATYRPDHIMYTADFKLLEARVVSEGESDHFPVVARLERVPSPATRPAEPR